MGCVSSRHKFVRRKSSSLKDSSPEKLSSSKRIDERIQPKLGFDRSNSTRGSNFKLIESKMFSSKRFHHENPEDMDQELRNLSTAVKPKVNRSNSRNSKRFYDNHQEPEKYPKHSEVSHEAAGWPTWLVSVAGEALVGWSPRRANTFEKFEKIGQGTYSSVYKARDLLYRKIVALKKVRFDLNDVESVKFMVREIIMMRKLDHPNVLKLEGLIAGTFSPSLYLVLEYMDHDLLTLSSRPNVKFSESQVKCYMQQLLSGLEHCHSRGVLHRDIKGSNLLINSNGVLKIADFGLATFFDPAQTVPLTSHVVTFWYRPPELLLGATHYGVGVDLWSTGCILGEFYANKPIMPGKTEVDQLHKIFKLCGSPTENYWRKYKLPSSAGFQTAIPYRRKLSEMYKDFPPSVLSLLETLLSIDPDHRSSAQCALESEYFKTKPFACDPSCLPKYPPSKEIDAKMHDEAKRQQHMKPQKQERQDSQTRRSLERKLAPPKQYKDFRRTASSRSFKEGSLSDYLNINSRNNPSERLSMSGPLHVKENAAPRYSPAKVKFSRSVSSKTLLDSQDQPVMNQTRRDRRAYSRSDTMNSIHMMTPVDPSCYNASNSKIYMSGPLLSEQCGVDQMIEEHDRELEELNRQAQKTRRV